MNFGIYDLFLLGIFGGVYGVDSARENMATPVRKGAFPSERHLGNLKTY